MRICMHNSVSTISDMVCLLIYIIIKKCIANEDTLLVYIGSKIIEGYYKTFYQCYNLEQIHSEVNPVGFEWEHIYHVYLKKKEFR